MAKFGSNKLFLLNLLLLKFDDELFFLKLFASFIEFELSVRLLILAIFLRNSKYVYLKGKSKEMIKEK